MSTLKNSEVLESILRALFSVASRRTTQSFAATVIGAIIKTLEQNYEFLRDVHIENPEYVNTEGIIKISTEVDTVDSPRVGKAIEAIIRIVYMDLVGKTGLFFMKELKELAGEQIILELKSYGVDLAILQTEQRYLHRQQRRRSEVQKTTMSGDLGKHRDDVSLLGYTWKNVGSWQYDPLQKTCVLYSKEGKELDRLNLETIIESYVTSITQEYEDPSSAYQEEVILTEKEIELLKMLSQRDIDAETARVLLHITKDEFEQIIRRLLQNELLHYVSYNEIELTEQGISFLAQKDQPANAVTLSS
ncbi:MAG TPA: hypothetical protein VMT57_00300 [Candidatus Thermoplasmatota archaeon]|nr:hypothetical protein [Candidatus Thermoplasmatota archaeon]